MRRLLLDVVPVNNEVHQRNVSARRIGADGCEGHGDLVVWEPLNGARQVGAVHVAGERLLSAIL